MIENCELNTINIIMDFYYHLDVIFYSELRTNISLKNDLYDNLKENLKREMDRELKGVLYEVTNNR
jgi:hypothetical protein